MEHTIEQIEAIAEYLDHYIHIARRSMDSFSPRKRLNRDQWSRDMHAYFKNANAALRWVAAENKKRLRRKLREKWVKGG